MTKSTHAHAAHRALPKAPTGIQGLDEITGGGLPRGRPTLICGGPGCGKTLLSMEFLVRGAMQYDEPGVFMAFEETSEELAKNVRSLGFDVDDLVAKEKLAIDFVRIERSEIEQTGDYDLEGLFVRLGYAIDSIGAKRVAIDTIETLFGGLDNVAILRAELRRLFRFLKDKGITAVRTGERGEGQLTRHGLEEYVSDCVILLDHRVIDQVTTRRLRVVKYRGSPHGTNEYPFLIDEDGISILPITSLGLEHKVSNERMPTGVARLDAMMGGGYYKGSTVLVSGTAGSGKSSMAAHFVNAACGRKERCLYFAFEESAQQIMRNMQSIGIDLQQWVKKGLLQFHASRSTIFGLEMHLVTCHKLIKEFEPDVVVLDPIGNLTSAGTEADTMSMLTRLMDYLKLRGITALWTSLTSSGGDLEKTDVGISSLVDTWLLLRDIELQGERNRAMYILKSRGMAHSNQIREFLLTDHGIELTDVYLGPEGVLTGSARQSQEAREKAAGVLRLQALDARRRERDRKREAMEARIAAMRKEFEAEEEEIGRIIGDDEARIEVLRQEREKIGRNRHADDHNTIGGATRARNSSKKTNGARS
jgi:circadian clock protein KaiC